MASKPQKPKRKAAAQKNDAPSTQLTVSIGESQKQLQGLAKDGEVILPERPAFKYKLGQRRLLQLSEPMCNLLMNLSAEGYTQVEIAALLGVHVDTLAKFLSANDEAREALDRGIEALKGSIRRQQVKQALAGDTTMLIWLGKQLLGQKDQRHVEASGAVTFTHTVQETRRWLEQEAASGDDQSLSESLPH